VNGSEVFTAVTMKNAVFWDVMPCGGYYKPTFGRNVPSPTRSFYPEDRDDTFSKTSVYNTPTRRHIPEEGILQDTYEATRRKYQIHYY
jgi:hypothetical protein